VIFFTSGASSQIASIFGLDLRRDLRPSIAATATCRMRGVDGAQK